MVGTALTHRSLQTPPTKAAVAQQVGGDPCWSSAAASEDDDHDHNGCWLSLSLALETRSSRSADEGGRLSPTGSRISLDLSLSTM